MTKKLTNVSIALSAAIVTVVVIRRLMQPKIVGRWEEQTEPRPTIWNFKSNGRLEITRWPWWSEMSYTIKANTVCITDSEGVSNTYLWRIEDDQLVLSGSEQAITLYSFIDEE